MGHDAAEFGAVADEFEAFSLFVCGAVHVQFGDGSRGGCGLADVGQGAGAMIAGLLGAAVRV